MFVLWVQFWATEVLWNQHRSHSTIQHIHFRDSSVFWPLCSSWCARSSTSRRCPQSSGPAAHTDWSHRAFDKLQHRSQAAISTPRHRLPTGRVAFTSASCSQPSSGENVSRLILLFTPSCADGRGSKRVAIYAKVLAAYMAGCGQVVPGQCCSPVIPPTQLWWAAI